MLLLLLLLGSIGIRCLLLKWPNSHALGLEKALEIANMRQKAIIFALELLQVAAALGAARYAVGHVAVEVLLRAVRAAIGERVTADLSDL